MPAILEAEWVPQNLSHSPFTLAASLPRLNPLPEVSLTPSNRYEAVTIGAGPSGLMLHTLLTRYGLPASSLLCIDARPHQTLVGNADGVNGRTLEILGQLGLEARILRDGRPFGESTIWTRSKSESVDASGEEKVDLKKIMRMPFHWAPARYEQLVTVHQGVVEGVLRESVRAHEGGDVQYGTRLVEMRMDEEGDADYPVVATIESNGVKEEIRTKYLIGADGARSFVRDFMGVEQEGDATDELWGVMDLVVDSDFPDVRRQSSIKAGATERDGFIVPRERLSNGDFLTRVYLVMTIKEEHTSEDSAGQSVENQQKATTEKRGRITEALILERAAELFKPYRFELKAGTQVHWWAAFRIGQRLAKSFTLKDSKSHPRVFIVGDACHSHSPRQGQGMNVSIQDSYNLAWKLAYTILGLDAANGGPRLLDTYEEERLPNARNLVTFDRRMNQEQRSMEEKMAEMKQFCTSCGVEYGEGFSVSKGEFRKTQQWTNEDYLNGVIYPGRRLLNCRVIRFADGVKRELHDELRAEGRFTILLLAGDDFGSKNGRSTKAADEVCGKVIKKFVPGLVQPIILQPHTAPEFEWTDMPSSIKEGAEMGVFNAGEDVYKTYGIESTGDKAGCLIVMRPDGVVGMMSQLEDTQQVVMFLERIVRTV